MAFYWAGTQIRTLTDFEAYLSGRPAPTWIKAATIHHTYIPTVESWRGKRTMDGIARHYRMRNKWDRGPHLFLAQGTPNPDHDGIWLATPLTMPGIHAGTCNSSRIGIEIVGDYDYAPWSPALTDLVYGVLITLGKWARFNPITTNGHRECLPNKSCPGKAINMHAVRAEVKRRMEPDYAAFFAPHTYDPLSGFGRTFAAEYAAGRSFGQALTPEFRDPADVVCQRFQNAFLTWTELSNVTIFRRES